MRQKTFINPTNEITICICAKSQFGKLIIENEVLKMIKIISDSTCDLSQEVLERYDIDIIPLHIVKLAIVSCSFMVHQF